MRQDPPILVAVVATAVTCILMATSTISIVMPEDAPKRAKALGENLPLGWIFVGEADGKVFFAEVERTMNWTMAADYCKWKDMTLASIETENQLKAVDEGLRPYYYDYWTSGREYRHYSTIIWDDTEDFLNMTLFPTWSFRMNTTDRDFQNCLLFYPAYNNDRQHFIDVYSCSNSDGRVLCQGT